MNKAHIQSILDRFSKGRILVVGDIMLDEYLEGSVERISPEAPIPVINLAHNGRCDVRLGGAANVFNNLFTLGGRDIYLCGVVGDDDNGRIVRRMIDATGADTSGIIVDPSRPTTVKTRIIAHNQQVIRLDRETCEPLTASVRSAVMKCIKQKLDVLDAVIFSDYEKGVITRELLADVIPETAGKNVITAVDPKFSNFRHFKNVTVIVPNKKEASGYFRHEIISDNDVLMAGRYMLERLGCECVLMKLGERGLRFLDAAGKDVSIQTAAEQVYDVTGAGDTVISVLVLAKTAGATWVEAARIANIAAGIVIHYVGTSPVDISQLKRALFENRFPKP